jgi:hypothetical protein
MELPIPCLRFATICATQEYYIVVRVDGTDAWMTSGILLATGQVSSQRHMCHYRCSVQVLDRRLWRNFDW